MQALRQDSVTRGAEINFGEAREVYLCEFKSVNQTKKMKTKEKKVFSSKIFTNSSFHLKILAIFHESQSEDKKKVFVSKVS